MKQNITPNKRKRNPFFSIVDLYYKKIVLNYYYYTLVTLVNKNLMEIVLITYIKYRKNRHILPTTIKKIALLALLLPLLSAILVFLDIILDTFVF